MSTPTIQQIHQHVSIRCYKNDPIPRAMIEEIVAASQRTSTSSNLQSWTVVAITSQEKREHLMALAGNQKHIVQAPLFLLWCADLRRQGRVCQLMGYEHEPRYVENFIISSVDAAIAMQTAALAAESMGLGICYIGSIRNNPREVIELLELPKLVFPICGMTLGWPDEEPLKKPRLPLEAILHWESYGVEDEDDLLRRYDEEIYSLGVYGQRMVPVPGSEGDTRPYSWMERTAKKVSGPTRVQMKEVLAEQGFELR